jgi:hypothetical protein
MKALKIYLEDFTYNAISIATDAFPLNIGFVVAYCKNKFSKLDFASTAYSLKLNQ